MVQIATTTKGNIVLATKKRGAFPAEITILDDELTLAKIVVTDEVREKLLEFLKED